MSVSSVVKEQYEEFPYPHRNPEDEKQRILHPYLASCEVVNHQCFAGRERFENFRVLIAGGGTGDTVIWWAEQLRGKSGASVTYLDLSAATAGVAKARAKIRKLDNITWIQDSLLNIPNLNLGQFDFIDCSGVLHHLQDPDAGLRALVTVLKPDGGMSLMVYAPYARAGVYQMQALMRLVNGGEASGSRKVANAQAVLKSLPANNIYNLQREHVFHFTDEEDAAGVYDLFLHSQDRAYTILEAHEWLERCGLKMAGEPGTHYMQEAYLPETFIQDKALLAKVNALPLPKRQAIGESLSGMITRHEFLVVRREKQNHHAAVDDDGMVPYCVSFAPYTTAQLAQFCQQRDDTFYVGLKDRQDTRVVIPAVPFRAEILAAIDGQKTVADIVGGNAEKRQSFEAIFKSLNRANMLYLRHVSVPMPLSASDLHHQMA